MDKQSIFKFILVTMAWVLFCYTPTEGATFLGIAATPKSQLIEMNSLLVGLAEKGHDVYMIIGEHPSVPPLPKHVIDSRVKLLTFKSSTGDYANIEKPEVQKEGIFAVFDNPIERYFPYKAVGFANNMTRIFNEYIGDLLADADLERKMKEIKPDMAVLHNVAAMVPTAYLVPVKFNIPYVTSVIFVHRESGVPTLTSFVPSLLTTYSDEMTFLQRTANFVAWTLFHTFSAHKIPPGFYEKYLPNVPQKTFSQLVSESELFIATGSHPSIDYPRLTLPNTIFAGGMMTRPGKPLSKELQSFMDEHKEGVIVVSFGSVAMYFPDHIIQKLLAAFAKIRYGIIWRYTGSKSLGTPPHVKALKWLPQNDLLAHPNTKLFISHCGNGGSFEALYHGIPVLGMPLMGDQFYNAYRGQKKGVAIVLDILNFTPEKIIENVNEMMENPSYYKTAKKLSTIYRAEPWTPREKAAYWIEHVLKYGGSYLRSPSALMPWYQYYSVDVVVFLSSIFACILVVCFTCCKCLCRRCCKRKDNKSTKVKTK